MHSSLSKKPILSIAPMMDWTDRHFRFFMRLITKRTLLYTEMITSSAILRGDREYLLGYSPVELPLVLQLGGDNPRELAQASKIGEEYGYSEINLNVGCPSSKVQKGRFGACLMAYPELVAECIATMKASTNLPVTVKHRIGIEGKEKYEDLAKFVEVVSKAKCDRFIVHARIAILEGLSPLQNRKIPPLRYEDVYQLKRDFPELVIEINGGILTLQEAKAQLNFIDGSMIGRAAYENPYQFSIADEMFFQDSNFILKREEILLEMLPYIEAHIKKGGKAHHILRHCLGLYYGQKGAKAYRSFLSKLMYSRDFNEICIKLQKLQLIK
jgi:tRNA-dihydrouridine synthase A